MFCPMCGAKVSDGARICAECGTPLVGLRDDAEVQDALVPVPADGVPESARQADPAANPATQVDNAAPDIEQCVPSSADSGLAPEPQQPKRSSMMSFLMERRQIGSRLVPTFAIIIASLIAAAGIAYAAIVLYKNVIEPNIQQPTQQEQTAEKGTGKKANVKTEMTVTVHNRSATVSVPVDPVLNPGERTNDTWTYPQLESSEKNKAVDRINSTIKDSVQRDIDYAAQSSADGSEGQDALYGTFGLCVHRDIVVSYLNDRYVCLRDERYQTNWGPHGWHDVRGFVFDLMTGKETNISALFNIDADSLAANTDSAIAPHMSSGSTVEDHTAAADKALAENGEMGDEEETGHGYYVSNEGLIYHSADYELGSYADGSVDVVVVPWGQDGQIGASASTDGLADGSSITVKLGD